MENTYKSIDLFSYYGCSQLLNLSNKDYLFKQFTPKFTKLVHTGHQRNCYQ